MNIRLPLSVFIFLFAICLNTAFSQLDNPIEAQAESKPFYFGPIGGINLVDHAANLQTFASVPVPCEPFDGGNGFGFYAGLSFEYLIGDAEVSQMSVIARIMYNTMDGSMETQQDVLPSLVVNPGQPSDIIFSQTLHEAEITYNALSLDLLYKFTPLEEGKFAFGVIAGPTFDFIMTKDLGQFYKLINSPNVRFKDNIPNPINGNQPYELRDFGQTLVVREGPIEDASSIRFGLKLGVIVEIETGQGFYIAPNAFYNLGLTNVQSAGDWTVNLFQVGVDVRWAITLF